MCSEIDIRLRAFVDDIAADIATMSPQDFVAHGQFMSFEAAVIIKLGLNSLSDRFASIVGQELVDEFYRDHEPKGSSRVFHLGLPLARLIPACCRPSVNGRISVDTDYLSARLRDIAKAIHAGKVDYSICMRITNIDIESDFDLADGVHFRKLPPDTVQSKYPIERHFFPVSPLSEQNWLKHGVEVRVGWAPPTECVAHPPVRQRPGEPICPTTGGITYRAGRTSLRWWPTSVGPGLLAHRTFSDFGRPSLSSNASNPFDSLAPSCFLITCISFGRFRRATATTRAELGE